MEAHGVRAAGAVGQGAVAQADLPHLPPGGQALLDLPPQGHGVGGVVAGGVEGQKPGADPGRKGEALHLVRQIPGGRLIGSLQIGAQILGLNAEIGQGAGGLHQGTAHQGTPRHVQCQGQLRRGGFGIQFPRSIHQQAASTSLQQARLLTQPAQHAEIFQILSRPVQGEGK